MLYPLPRPWEPPLFLVAVRMPVVGLAQHVAAARFGGPIFPSPPSLGRIGAVAAVAGIDLALREILDLAAQLLRPHQSAGVARQIDRHAYHLDEGAHRRAKAVAAHHGHTVLA